MEEDRFLKGFLLGMFVVLFIVLLSVLLYLGLFHGRGDDTIYYADESSLDEDKNEYNEFVAKQNQILNAVDRNYYEEADKNDMYEGAYRGMLDALEDPYTCYFSAEEMKSIMQNTGGEYVGIGCTVGQNKDTNEIVVLSVIDNSPADKSGMKPNDIIIAVDGQDVTGMDLDYAMTFIKGEEGAPVTITVKRDNTKLDLNMVRAKVEYITTSYRMLEDGIGYIYIANFYKHTDEQIKAALADMEGQGMQKLIIDLRENPGGLYDVAVSVLDIMLKEKLLVVYTMDKNGNKRSSYTENPDSFEKPLVILINENSASASELFTQTMRDYGKATVIGTTSYGKGVYQDMLYLGNDGSGMKITGGRYYSPKDICIDGVGIVPDIEVELNEELVSESILKREDDNQLQAAIDYLKKE